MPPGLRSDFNSLANEYAQFRSAYSRPLFQSIFDYARQPAPADVLDLACGTGLGMLPYVERGDKVIGIDIAPAMIDVAQRSLPETAQVKFCVTRAEALPFAVASFDLVSCAQSFHWFDASAAFAESARVLRRGGTLAVFWKHAARDDPFTRTGEAIIAEWLGEDAAARSRDHAATNEDFAGAFWHYVQPAGAASSPAPGAAPLFANGEKRMFSFVLPRTIASFVGYQRSREKIRMVLGERREAFLKELERRLHAIAQADRPFDQRQVEYLFLARKL